MSGRQQRATGAGNNTVDDTNGMGRGKRTKTAASYEEVDSDCDFSDHEDKKPAARRKKAKSSDEDDDEYEERKPAARADSNEEADEHADHAKVRARYEGQKKENLKKMLGDRNLSTAGNREARIARLVNSDQYAALGISALRKEVEDRNLEPKARNTVKALVACLVEDDERNKYDESPRWTARHEEPRQTVDVMKRLGASDMSMYGLKKLSDPNDEVNAPGIGPSKDHLPTNTNETSTCQAERAARGNKAKNDGILITGSEGTGAEGAAKRINEFIEEKTMVKAGYHGYNAVEGHAVQQFNQNNCVTCLPCNKSVFVVNANDGGGTYHQWERHKETKEHKINLKMGGHRPKSDEQYLKKIIKYLGKDKELVPSQRSFIKKNISVTDGELKFKCKHPGCSSNTKATMKKQKLQFGTARSIILLHLDRVHGITGN